MKLVREHEPEGRRYEKVTDGRRMYLKVVDKAGDAPESGDAEVVAIWCYKDKWKLLYAARRAALSMLTCLKAVTSVRICSIHNWKHKKRLQQVTKENQHTRSLRIL